MELYLVGCVIAFLIGVGKMAALSGEAASIKARNMEKLGLHLQASTGSYQPQGTTGGGWVALAIWNLVIAPFGSWLSVASAIWGAISAKKQEVPATPEVRAVQEMVASQPLSKEQLVEAQESVARALNKAGPVYTGEGNEDPSTLVLEDHDGWLSEVTANPTDRTLVFYGHSDDYHSVFHSTEEYLFEGNQLLTRLTEDYVEHPGEQVWHVKDGVVLETAIRDRLAKVKFALKSADEEIAEYKAQVQWRAVKHRKLRFFVMAQHPAEFPARERRRLIRTELERVEVAARAFVAEAKTLGLDVVETEHGTELKFPNTFTDADKARARLVLFNDQKYAEFGLHPAELAEIKNVRRDLLALLGEDPAK